jgi:pimeloyl-ACP methyl ester carboxylesterase
MIPPEMPQALMMRTASGRQVGYYEYGDPNGTPVLVLHGTPTSGAGFVWADDAARARGIRLVAPDRPGIGYSDRLPQRLSTVTEYVPELIATADALDIDRFSLLGYSGGAPYALAVAHSEPARVRAAAVVAGAGQIGVWASIDDFEATDRRMSRLATRAPALARATLLLSARASRLAPDAASRIAQLEMSATDREIMASFPSSRAALAGYTQAFLRGADGVVDDYAAQARPWDLDVGEITVPIRLWHATDDRAVPLRHSEELAARLPDAQLTTWEGEGHLALIERVGEVLDGLLELAGHT